MQDEFAKTRLNRRVAIRAKQLRLDAIKTQLDTGFTYCSTAEKALFLGKVERGRQALAHARYVAQKTREHMAEPHHVPDESLPGLHERVKELDAQISSIEGRSPELKSPSN